MGYPDIPKFQTAKRWYWPKIRPGMLSTCPQKWRFWSFLGAQQRFTELHLLIIQCQEYQVTWPIPIWTLSFCVKPGAVNCVQNKRLWTLTWLSGVQPLPVTGAWNPTILSQRNNTNSHDLGWMGMEFLQIGWSFAASFEKMVEYVPASVWEAEGTQMISPHHHYPHNIQWNHHFHAA
jgi:hypothetical protein